MASVLITVQSLHHGGMEKIVSELALGLHARGHEVCVLGVHEKGGAYADRLSEAGVEVHTGLGRRRMGLMGNIMSIRRLCRANGSEFAIAAMGGAMHAPCATLIACRWAGVPCVRWLHTMPGEAPISAFRLLVQRMMTRAGNTVVALTETHARALAERWGIPPSQIVVIWNGQRLPPRKTPERAKAVRNELGLSRDRFVVGIVAVFRAVKRHEVLIRAMARAVKQMPTAHLLLVGDGGTRPAAEHLVDELGLRGHVTFAGARSDAPRLYAAMDAHVLCSYPQETFPLAVTEAMAAGVAPIATRVGSVPELISDGETGLIVDPESPEALSDAIVALAADAPRRDRMADAAHRFAVSHFSLEAMVDRFAELIESARSRRSG